MLILTCNPDEYAYDHANGNTYAYADPDEHADEHATGNTYVYANPEKYAYERAIRNSDLPPIHCEVKFRQSWLRRLQTSRGTI